MLWLKFCSLQQLSPSRDTGAEFEHKLRSSLAGMDPPLAQLPSPQRLTGMFTQSSFENKLRFVCTFRSDSLRRSGRKEYDGDTHCESVSVVVPAQCSVYQLRLRICMQVGNPPPKHPHPRAIRFVTMYSIVFHNYFSSSTLQAFPNVSPTYHIGILE